MSFAGKKETTRARRGVMKEEERARHVPAFGAVCHDLTCASFVGEEGVRHSITCKEKVGFGRQKHGCANAQNAISSECLVKPMAFHHHHSFIFFAIVNGRYTFGQGMARACAQTRDRSHSHSHARSQSHAESRTTDRASPCSCCGAGHWRPPGGRSCPASSWPVAPPCVLQR